MPTNPHKPKGVRLGTRFRGKLAAAYGQRGVGAHSLWYVYSPRTRSDWVLRSDLEWDHFVLAESDPDIVESNFALERHAAKLNGKQVIVQVDATIKRRDGRIEWRRVRFNRPVGAYDTTEMQEQVDGARALGADLVEWTEESIRQNQLLLANWRRVLAWLSAARDHSLGDVEHDIALAFKDAQYFTLQQVETRFGESAFPLYAAALFGALQRGQYFSDLDAMPLSPSTVLTPWRHA